MNCKNCGYPIENISDMYFEEDYFYKEYKCKCGSTFRIQFDIIPLYLEECIGNGLEWNFIKDLR